MSKTNERIQRDILKKETRPLAEESFSREDRL